MKHSKTSRLLSVVLAMLMVFGMFPVTAFAADTADHVVINQAYGGGGNSGAEYKYDFVELYNPTGSDVSLDGWSVQYASKTGTFNNVTALSGTIKAGGYYLIQMAAGSGGTKDLPTPDATGTASMSAKEFKLALASNTDKVSGKDDEDVVDFLGVSSTANEYEGTGPAPTASNTKAVIRATDGVDTDDNKADFVTADPNPRNSAVAPNPVDPDPDPEPEVPTGPIKGGDQVVIYNPAHMKALSTSYSGYYNKGVDVAVGEGELTGYTDAEIWTVIDNGDGTFGFATADGKKLSMGANYSSMPLDDVNTAWTVAEATTENCYYITNAARGVAVEYQDSYGTWSSYYVSDANEALFAQMFYVIGGENILPEKPEEPEQPEEPTEPETVYAEKITEAPLDGDVVLIYNSAKVMGSAPSGKKMSGVAATVEEGKIAITEEMAQLAVTVDEDGNYIFTLGEKYLTSAESGNGISLSDELTDCGKWTISEAVEGAWYITNVGANYNGNYNQAMEYYNGFTTYGIKETAIYQMEFFLVSRPSEDGKITSADKFVSGKYVMVVETGYAMGKLDGTWVSAVQPVVSGDKVIDAKGGLWTLTVDGNSVSIVDSNGVAIKPKGGNSNGISSGDYQWSWSFNAEKGTFSFKGTGSDTVTLASNANEDPTYGGFHKFRAYKNTTVSGNPATYPCEFTLYAYSEEGSVVAPPKEGEKVVIYNTSATGVLGAESDVKTINNVVADKDIPEFNLPYYDEVLGFETVSVGDGAVLFTVSKNGTYYRFYNETYGYLCSNGTGNNAFYSQEATEDADWLILAGKEGGWNLESRTAKYNGQYSQYLEYYGDSYKTYSMYNVTDYSIYEFHFYKIDEEAVTLVGDIVHDPDVEFESDDAYIGQDWEVKASVIARFDVKEAEVQICDGYGSNRVVLSSEHYTVTKKAGETVYEIVVPAEMVKEVCEAQLGTLESYEVPQISVEISVEFDGVNHGITAGYSVNIHDEPSIGEISPKANEETKENKRPVISAEIINAGEDANIHMAVNAEAVDFVYDGSKVTYTPASDLEDGRTTVFISVERADGKVAEKTWSFVVGEAQFEFYFGQLHSHTTYSDGSGSLDSALDYIAGLPESANVDFVAFTDHSNYFDSSSAANPEGALYDMSLASAGSQNLWNEYKSAVASFNASQTEVVAIAGFEMTWFGGPGHMNTFNTPGIVSRNNSTLNNKTNDAGMKAYYALLSQIEGADSISQFNHPGSTFGTFSDFAYWDAVIDSRIYLVEVGNGEGQIGAGGYYPSYEYYTMALDKGWHVAPTNNQDNHKGKWGNANDARDVVITDDFSENGIYAAIRALRMYSTEDKNLEIMYTVNGQMLGSSITEVPEKLNLNVTVYDPDKSDSISKVEVIVNSGKVAYTWDDPALLAAGDLSVTLDPEYSYYYIRVTEGDGDLAVTAPVWVGESLKLGISSVATTTTTPVTNEELTITTTLFNSESSAAEVKSLTYTTDGGVVIGTDTNGYSIPASGNLEVTYNFTPSAAKITVVTVTAVVELDGTEYVFTMDLELDVQDAEKLVYVGIDASHYNEYVNGNYKDSMGNFSQLAAEYGVRTVTLYSSEDLVAACSNPKYKALILTAPSRRSTEAQASDPLKVYTAEEIAAIKEFNAKGGTVVLAGWSDHYENYPSVASIANMKAEEHMAATQNALLEALGSSLRIGDDATYDDQHNGGQAYRLYFNSYNFDNFLVEGVEVDEENPHDRLYTEVFSHYGGASVYTVGGTLPSTVSPVVFGHSGTYSVDVDTDGLGGSSMYKYEYAEGDSRLMIMATEQLEGQGLIIVSGAAFMSNFEVQATIEDSGSEKNYSNYKVCENLLAYINPVIVTPIEEVRAQSEAGYKYTIEGVVTSNASGYDKDTAFFDCIYVQDETAGICCFPVAGNFKIGDKVRIAGTTEFYQGEPELQVTSIELISEGNEVTAKEVTAEQINSREVEGQLVKVRGIITNYEYENGLIQTIYVKNYENDEVVRVFIDGYITIDKDVENIAIGADVTVTGLASYDDTFNAPEGPFQRIRIRNRADVVVSGRAYVTVTFEGNGGEVKYPMMGYPYGSRMSNVQVPTREGYVFDGWYDEDGNKLTDEYVLFRDTTFTAQWKEKTNSWFDNFLNGNVIQRPSGIVVTPSKGENETNPGTGAPVSSVSAIAAIAVLSAVVLGKRK